VELLRGIFLLSPPPGRVMPGWFRAGIPVQYECLVGERRMDAGWAYQIAAAGLAFARAPAAAIPYASLLCTYLFTCFLPRFRGIVLLFVSF
jgi:hypothetical protein